MAKGRADAEKTFDRLLFGCQAHSPTMHQLEDVSIPT